MRRPASSFNDPSSQDQYLRARAGHASWLLLSHSIAPRNSETYCCSVTSGLYDGLYNILRLSE